MYVLDSTIGHVVRVTFLDHTQDDPNGIATCTAYGRVTEVHNVIGYIRLVAWETPADPQAAKSNGETSFCIAIGCMVSITWLTGEQSDAGETEQAE